MIYKKAFTNELIKNKKKEQDSDSVLHAETSPVAVLSEDISIMSLMNNQCDLEIIV